MHFHLTAVSQRVHYTSVQFDSKLVLFNQLWSNKAVVDIIVHQSYNIKRLGQLPPFATG